MRTALVAGLGLIGGAVGMALRRAGWRVTYLDPHVSLDEAQRAAAADGLPDDSHEVIVLATPVDVAVELLRTLGSGRAEARPTLVTSVCSVMGPFVGDGCIAGHPMAGWHEGGLANAHHVTLDGARWFLSAEHPLVDELVRACGATPVLVDPHEHDAAMAVVSHLPQVLSTALFAHLGDQPHVEQFAGAGLRSFRLAASDGAMWHSVLAANREHLSPHADAIAELVRAIIEGRDVDAFARARRLWQSLQR
ncbi:MAG TPA: prephenate dehydrogenase dimerization domain-containing protein [Thermoanaerobaculia bacterium]|jgi:prephenate dehydrogenase|nr:prephenate dehydrogenase dimerization domain-containing protein [Thermoanaerobaculia bacterium]